MPTRKRVYMAGPMFSIGDKDEQLALDKALAKKYDVHLPQRDGVEVASVMGLLNSPELHGSAMLESVIINRIVVWVTRIVEALDVFQSVEGCQCVVLNLDGRVPDEGSLVEATLAWYVGMPVVPYKTTPITELGINNNPMVNAICGWAPPWNTPAAVVAAVDKALTAPPAVDLECVPAHVQLFCELGRTVWTVRRRRSWTAADVAKALTTFQSLPSAMRDLIEAEPRLQQSALEVVVTIIEFSRLKPGDPRQKTIIKQLISDSKKWSKKPGIRKAILDNPVTA